MAASLEIKTNEVYLKKKKITHNHMLDISSFLCRCVFILDTGNFPQQSLHQINRQKLHLLSSKGFREVPHTHAAPVFSSLFPFISKHSRVVCVCLLLTAEQRSDLGDTIQTRERVRGQSLRRNILSALSVKRHLDFTAH